MLPYILEVPSPSIGHKGGQGQRWTVLLPGEETSVHIVWRGWTWEMVGWVMNKQSSPLEEVLPSSAALQLAYPMTLVSQQTLPSLTANECIIHLFNKYLSSIYYVAGLVLSAAVTAGDKRDQTNNSRINKKQKPCPRGAYFQMEVRQTLITA